MISKELVSTKVKIRHRIGFNKCITLRTKSSSNNMIICAFKCSKCGETDEEIAEKYCGNEQCPYR